MYHKLWSEWSLVSVPNPFATKHSTRSPHLILPRSLPPRRASLSVFWLLFLRALSPAILAYYDDVPSGVHWQLSDLSLHRPPRNRRGLPVLATPEPTVLQNLLVGRLAGTCQGRGGAQSHCQSQGQQLHQERHGAGTRAADPRRKQARRR